MYPADKRILEYLAEEPWGLPTTMESEPEFQQLDIDSNYIFQRCEKLVERELISPIVEDEDMNEVTRWGLAYLRGDLYADHLNNW